VAGLPQPNSFLKEYRRGHSENGRAKNEYSHNRILSSFGYESGCCFVEVGLLLTPHYFIVIEAGLLASFRQQRELRREFVQAFIGQ